MKNENLRLLGEKKNKNCHPGKVLAGVSRLYSCLIKKGIISVNENQKSGRYRVTDSRYDNFSVINRNNGFTRPSSFPRNVVGNIGAALYPRQKTSGMTAWGKPSGMTNAASGFTLIELLVVVLIIGILAAVALPQYQTFVDKSRYIRAIYVVDALVKAQKVYYLENGCFADSLEKLAIEPPVPPTAQTGYKYNYPWGSCKLYTSGAGGANCTVLLGSSSVDYAVEINPYARRCWVRKEDRRGQRLCQTVTHTTTAYNAGSEYYYLFD